MNDHQMIARKIMPYVNTLSEKYSQLQKIGMYDDDDLAVVGSIAAALKEFTKRRIGFYTGDYSGDDEEDDECDYVRYLEKELTNLMLLVYHVHKSEFDEFVDSASNLETDDIISSVMN